MSGKTNYSGRLWMVLVVAIGGVQLECGGRRTPAVAPCDDGYNKIMEKKDDAICDPAQMNLFEIQVTKWRDECTAPAQGPLGKEVSQKLSRAQECSENRRRLEMTRTDCTLRLEEVVTGSLSCLGEGCTPYWDDLKTVTNNCEIPELAGAFSEKIGSLKAQLDERTKEAERLGAMGQLIILCDQFVEITDENQAAGVFDQILQQISETAPMKEVPQAESEVARYRQAASESCDSSLSLSLEVLIPAISKTLDDKKFARSSRRWKREFERLATMYKSLMAVDGAALFPEAFAQLESAVGKYDPKAIKAGNPAPSGAAPTKSDKKENGVPPAETSTPAAKTAQPSVAKEVAAPSAPPAAADQPPPKKDAAQCQELKTRAAHFEAKVAEYQKKGNDGKTSAYQTKLDETNKALEACTAK